MTNEQLFSSSSLQEEIKKLDDKKREDIRQIEAAYDKQVSALNEEWKKHFEDNFKTLVGNYYLKQDDGHCNFYHIIDVKEYYFVIEEFVYQDTSTFYYEKGRINCNRFVEGILEGSIVEIDEEDFETVKNAYTKYETTVWSIIDKTNQKQLTRQYNKHKDSYRSGGGRYQTSPDNLISGNTIYPILNPPILSRSSAGRVPHF